MWFFDVRENSHCSEMNARSTAAALVNTPAASVPTARSVKHCDISGTVLCDETALLEWPLIGTIPKHTCALIMLLLCAQNL